MQNWMLIGLMVLIYKEYIDFKMILMSIAMTYNRFNCKAVLHRLRVGVNSVGRFGVTYPCETIDGI
jgi:hypothetical protein